MNYLITADLGLLRAYRLVPGEAGRVPHPVLIEEYRPAVAHEKVSEQVSDGAGHFPGGGASRGLAGDPSGGEDHGRQLEQTRRLLRALAGRLDVLLRSPDAEGCWLAASPRILPPLLDELAPEVRAKIDQTVPRDLTKVPAERLHEHLVHGVL